MSGLVSAERLEALIAAGAAALLPVFQVFLLLIAGYVGARLASRATAAAMRRVGDKRLEPVAQALNNAGLHIGVPELAGRCTFAVVFIIVTIQASAVAGLQYFGDLADSIIHTVPTVGVGLALLLIGVVAGRQAGALAAALAVRGPVPPRFVGAATQGAIVVAAAVSAVDAMGIATTLPVALITLGVAALFGLVVVGGVLSARGVLENVAAARYVEETLIEGQRVRFRGEETEVETIDILATVLRTDSGRHITIPNSLLQREAV